MEIFSQVVERFVSILSFSIKKNSHETKEDEDHPKEEEGEAGKESAPCTVEEDKGTLCVSNI